MSTRDSLTSSLDITGLSAALQTAAAAAEQFTARVAQTLGISPASLPNQPNAVPPQISTTNATGFAQLFANLIGGRGNGAGQPFGQLQQVVNQLTKAVQQAVQATGKQRDAANLQVGKLQDGADQMFGALARGNSTVADFATFLGRADTAVQGFADNLAKVGQMQFGRIGRGGGLVAPQSPSIMRSMMTTVAQVQNYLSQFSKQIGQSIQGGQQIQQLVDAANASGNPQQAIDIARSYAQAQLNQSFINAQNLSNSVDPIMHSFGAPGQLAPQGNLAYLLSQPGQLSDTIRMFQSMLSNLDKMQAKLAKAPHMAAGGVVTDPTMALVGERGPEAIIPLSRLQAMFGNPANLFPVARAFPINPGDGAINPLGLTPDRLANFDMMFNRASTVLNQQLDLGNSGAGAILDRWNQIQDATTQAVDWMSQSRRIDLGPSSLDSRSAGSGMSAATQGMFSALHFNFGDINVSGGMTQQEIGSLFDRIENEARSRGYDMTGRAALRRPPQSTRGPLTPAGYAR
jgi:hypothetical protein